MKNVLFLCTGNSCRSIMAEGLLNNYGKGKYQAFSAGSFPTGQVHPMALATLQANGIDLPNPRSKSWDEFKDKQIDLLVTVCDNAAGEVCPIFPGRPAKLHWGMPDPAPFKGTEAEVSAEFQRVYDGLHQKITDLIAEDEFVGLRHHMGNLFECSKNVFHLHNSAKRGDLYARILTIFIQRQLDHANSIMKLGDSFDTTLIARSMIEGLFNLLWIGEKKDERLKLWNEFSCICNLRLMHKKEVSGKVDATEKARIIKEVEKHGNQFLTNEGRKAKEQGKTIQLSHYADNYRNGVTLKKVSEELAAKYEFAPYLYEFYSKYSDWSHWGKQAMEGAAPTEDHQISYYDKGYLYATPALTNAYQCLIHTVEIFNGYFDYKQEEQIQKVQDEFLKFLGWDEEIE